MTNPNLYRAWERVQLSSDPVHKCPPPQATAEGLRAYADVLRAQEEAVEGAARRASEQESRQQARKALRRRHLSSPAVQYYAGAQFISIALALHFGLWFWFLVVGTSLVTSAIFSAFEDG